MKKNIFTFSALGIVFILSSFVYSNWNIEHHETRMPPCSSPAADSEMRVVPDFTFDIDTRFNNTVSKSKLNQATTIGDILPSRATEEGSQFRNVVITKIGKDHEISISGNDQTLNEKQLWLIDQLDYSSDFYIKADRYTGPAKGCARPSDHIVYYMTVIPENQASYSEGKDKLIQFLRENSNQEVSKISSDEIRPGKIHFIVSKNGEIEQTELNSTSGSEDIDEKLLELLSNLPAKWTPATNRKGEKHDQELVLSFGKMGC